MSGNEQPDGLYRLKKVNYKGNIVPLVMQNINGPCPLLAICNVLLLRGEIRIHPDYSAVTYEQLVILLGDLLLGPSRPNIPPEYEQNYNQNVADAVQLFPTLQRGLDVNVRFKSISDFEFTQELSVFDLFSIRLVHGWLVDPQDEPAHNAVGSLSYNEAVERLIHLQTTRETLQGQTLEPEQQKIFKQEQELERFFTESASQLTIHGLMELHFNIRENEYCVFFRNNHFSVLHKHEGDLYLLVTDQGYLYKSNIMWERFDEVDGDSIFLGPNFAVYNPDEDTPEAVVQHNELINDEQLALQLQREEEQAQENATKALLNQQLESDAELARRLQAEENAAQRGGPPPYIQ